MDKIYVILSNYSEGKPEVIYAGIDLHQGCVKLAAHWATEWKIQTWQNGTLLEEVFK